MKNGEPINKIAETSGLSRGELELLRLLKANENADQQTATNIAHEI